MSAGDTRPIGIFDSGMGGLTVMRAIGARLPKERIVYLGDTARLPYGTKSAETVTRYAVQAVRHLRRYDVKAIVVACNTASAVALPALEAALSPLPVIGVVGPGARAAVGATRTGRIAVIATEGTVRGGAYALAIHQLHPGAQVVQRACPLFVALAEEGWVDGPVAALTAERYLSDIFAGDAASRPDTLVLGCTHFPALAGVIAKAAGPGVALVDSAATAAEALAAVLEARGLAQHAGGGAPQFLATDAIERFARVGGLFLGQEVPAGSVELVDLNQ
ncbi:MAG: glutamate racemase [Alphaproteobacteria bacterium]|nr:glutamate racemase [Alphaproteobacteria bacterium]